jgi:hypothetical protein
VPQRSRLQYARVEPLTKASAFGSLLDPLREKLPQLAPVQLIDNSTDICIDSPVAVQRPTLLTPLVQRVLGTLALPEAVGKGMESLRNDGLSDHPHCPLDDLVRAAGFAYGPLPPLVLLDPHPFDGRRHRPIVAPPCMQVPQGVLQVLGIRLRRDLIQAWGTPFLGLVRGFP